MAAESREFTTGILVGIADALIFHHFVGASAADIRTAEPFNQDIEKSERLALYTATGFTLVVAGLARSARVFAIGGLVIVALDFGLKHANAVNPTTGKMGDASEHASTSYPMPDYAS